ncbi:NUDIX domain-containing protein [Patescibacteria group bacterium]
MKRESNPLVAKNTFITCRSIEGGYQKVSKEKLTFRLSAYGFIYEDGKVVTVTNKSNGKIWYPGGGIVIGEKIKVGLSREIREETGLKVKVGEIALVKENFFYYKPLDKAYHALLIFYHCQPLTHRLLPDNKVDDIESIEPRWTNISDIKKKDIGDISNDIYKVLQTLK